MGGIPTKLPLQEWPVEKEIYYLIPDSWPMAHPHARHFQQCDLSFIDMLSSCDALVTKPGYGNFSEAACNNIPVLYLKRGDWPEEPYLIDWLAQYGRGLVLSRKEFFAGKFSQALKQLPDTAPNTPKPNGAQQAAALILKALTK